MYSLYTCYTAFIIVVNPGKTVFGVPFDVALGEGERRVAHHPRHQILLSRLLPPEIRKNILNTYIYILNDIYFRTLNDIYFRRTAKLFANRVLK